MHCHVSLRAGEHAGVHFVSNVPELLGALKSISMILQFWRRRVHFGLNLLFMDLKRFTAQNKTTRTQWRWDAVTSLNVVPKF